MSLSNEVSLLNSLPPQLMETSVAPVVFADETAFIKSVKLLVFASTSTILAPGGLGVGPLDIQRLASAGSPVGDRERAHRRRKRLGGESEDRSG